MLKTFKWCVIIPTYNNEKTVEGVIEGVLNYTNNVFVVNDGSTDRTNKILSEFEELVTILKNDVNQGKGYTLRRAFKACYEKGFTHAVTIDSDGQHFPSDIPALIEESKETPDDLIIGSRDMKSENVPGRSSFGNNFSNFWFYVETGQRLNDTQSGFRVYPLDPLSRIKLFSNKFELEIEAIVKLAWKGVNVRNVPVKIYYSPAEERISHFRPFKDFSRVSIMNAYLVTLALVYYIPRRFLNQLNRRNIEEFIRKHFLDKNESTLRKSLSVGFGVLMGIIPVWGYQMLIAIFLAHLLKLNKAIVLVSANISIPPMIPLIIYASYVTGSFIPPFQGTQIEWSSDLNVETIGVGFAQYVVGAFALSFLAGIFAFVVSYALISIYRSKKI